MQRPRISAQISSASLTKIKDIKMPIGGVEAWQRDAYLYYEVIGEVGFVINLTANTVASCDIRPIEINSEVAPGGWKETENEKVLRVWDALTGPRGSKAELYRKATLNLQIAGECYLVGLPIVDESGREAGISWEFLSPEELKIEKDGKVVKRIVGGFGKLGGQQLIDLDPNSSYIARLWRSDPRYSERPDCALKHILPICHEVVVLTQVVDAIAKSRLPAGMLFVPDEMSFGPFDETEDDSENTDDIDLFTQELIEHLTSPVEDRTSAASLVPLLVRGPAEFADKIKNIEVARNLDSLYIELRSEAIRRIATGLDIPPELIEGKGGLNHWTGYNIDNQFISKHVVPIGEMLAEFLTSAYLRPMLVEFEGMSEQQAAEFKLFFDPSKITSRTDTATNARVAYDRKEISRIAFLRESGFDEADAPDIEERKERDLRDLMIAEPIIFGPQIIGMLYPELAGKLVLPTSGENNPSQNPDPGNPAPFPERKNHTGPKKGIPVTDPESGQGEPVPRGPDSPRMEESILDRLATGADAALERALERAGNRILSKMNGSHASVRDRLRTIPRAEIISHITENELRQLGLNLNDLFSEVWDNLAVKGKGWLLQYFTDQGFDHYIADEKASLVMSCLVSLLEVQAMSAFKSPLRVGPNGLRVPYDLVEKAFNEHERIST